MSKKIAVDRFTALAVERWRSLVNQYAGYYGLDADLILADIAVESGGNPEALSSAGARGLMQIMPETLPDINGMIFRNYKPDDLFLPYVAVECGMAYWRFLIDYYSGDEGKAAQAYFAGIGNVRKNASAGIDYRDKVFAYRDMIKNQRGITA